MYVGADVNQDEAVLVWLDNDGTVLADPSLPRELAAPQRPDPGERLNDVLERSIQHLRRDGIEALVLTDSNVSQTRPSSVRSRAEIEAVLQVAARRCDLPVRVVHQQSVALYLGLRKSANKGEVRQAVASHVDQKALRGEPERRARAIGAVWQVIGKALA